MKIELKFVTHIIRPWERLNQELINQNSIDSNISEILSIAEDLSVKLSHFPEFTGQTAVRSIKNSIDFNTIVDIADIAKHKKLDNEDRNNVLYLSSLFECRDDKTFRFIRNKIIIRHKKYGKSDFLDTFKIAANFIINKLKLNLFWNPNILEAPNTFNNEVFLSVHYQHQIAWSSLNLEFFKRAHNGELVSYNPKEYLFELRFYQGITAENYFDYVYKLFENSIDKDFTIKSKTKWPSIDPLVTSNFDFLIQNITKASNDFTLVKIIENVCSLSQIREFENVARNTKSVKIILVSNNEFTQEIKEFVSESCSNIFLVTVGMHEAENIPIGFFNINYKHAILKVIEVKSAVLGVLKKDEKLFANIAGKPISELGCNFSFDKLTLMNFEALCLSHVKPKNGAKIGNVNLSISPRDKRNIYFKIQNTFVKIGFNVDFNWSLEMLDLHMPILTFNKSQLGTSIWNLETNSPIGNGRNKLSIQVIKYGDTSAIGVI